MTLKLSADNNTGCIARSESKESDQRKRLGLNIKDISEVGDWLVGADRL